MLGLNPVIRARKKRVEMGGAVGLQKILLEPKKVVYLHTYLFLNMEFTALRDDISKKIYRNHKKLKLQTDKS